MRQESPACSRTSSPASWRSIITMYSCRKKFVMKAAAPPVRDSFFLFMTMMTVMTVIQAYPPQKRGIPKKHRHRRHHRHRKKIALTERNSYRKHSAWISRAQTGGSPTPGFGIGSRNGDEVRRRFPIRLYPILRKSLCRFVIAFTRDSGYPCVRPEEIPNR